MWYPIDEHTLEAIAGPKKGEKIEFLDKPPKMPLREWVEKHPNTKVLLGSRKNLQELFKQN